MKMMKFTEISVGLAVLLGSSACTSIWGPENRVRDELPEAYRASSDGETTTNEWWVAFGDAQLDRLVGQALGGNLSIEQAAARLRQAEASAVKSGASRFPSVNGTADGETAYTHVDGAKTVSADDYGLGLSASYELDLWGRVSSGYRAANQSLTASRFDLQTAAMSVAGQTATKYFEWQYLQGRKAVLTAQLESRRKMLSVIERRFQSAQADALAVLQQRKLVAAAEAALPPVTAELRAAGNALAVLVGLPPQADLELVVLSPAELPVRPAAGLPADLLSRRPDLSAAWARLASADWNVRAAKADRLPAITLTGKAAYGDENVDALFDNWVMNLASGLSVPLIDGGRLRAEVRRVEAVADENLAAYRESVLDALTEVEDALSAETLQQEYLQAVRRQLAASASSAEEAYRRYTSGVDSYFEALSEETLHQALEVTVLKAQYDLLADRVQLYRVLGGDWGTILQTYRTTDDEQGKDNE